VIAAAWAQEPGSAPQQPAAQDLDSTPPTEEPAAPEKTDPATENPVALTSEQRAALADYELLSNLDLLQDLEVARYLDLLRMEED